MLVWLLVGLEMYLRVEQEGDRRQASSGRSLETWSEQRNVWMNWSSRAPRSLNNSPNTKTIRDILYTQPSVHRNVRLVLSLMRPSATHANTWCCSDPWPHTPRWATSRIRTSAQLAVSRIRQSLQSRLQPTQNWRFRTQKGWDGRSQQLPECLERVRVVANSDVCVIFCSRGHYRFIWRVRMAQ